MSATTEAATSNSAVSTTPTCEAHSDWLDAICGLPAAGLYRRACVHEHIRDGYVCADHVKHVEIGYCAACYEVDGHECPITLVLLTEVTP